jgi:hypothetical protein
VIGPVTWSYYACDLRTGLILEDLRNLSPSGALGRRLGVSTTANAVLALSDTTLPLWVDATTPGRTMVVAVDDQAGLPTWAGIILTRKRGSATQVQLGLATPECYLDRRYTGDYTAAVGADQAVIMTGLGAPLLVNAPNFSFDAPASGVTLDAYAVQDGDDRTILSTWQEVMGLGGVEFTIDPVWADAARTTIQLVIRIRTQVGSPLIGGLPEVVLDFPGCVSSYTQTEDYSSGKGATDVLAWGNGQGNARLKSSVHTASALIAGGWPSWVDRFTPAAGLDDPVQLDAHAAEELAQVDTGTSTWEVACTASQTPRVGSDWGLGDSLRLHVAASPGHPKGADIVARNYGWDMDLGADSVSPVLVEGG